MNEGGGWNALFWCNHDHPRIVSRFGDEGKYHKESAEMLATTLHMMQGTPYIYQGEEIGMTNPGFRSIDEFRDVESLNAFEMLKRKGKSEQEIIEILNHKSRDNSRTPMQWTDEANAGFTTGTPWIDLARNYREISVEKSIQDPDSIFYHYQKLIRLRKTYDIISNGDYRLLIEDDPNVFAYMQNWKNEHLLVISNFYGNMVDVSLPVEVVKNPTIIISNYRDSQTT